MNPDSLRPYFLLAVLIGIAALLFFVLKPFLVPLLLAAMFAVVLNPVYQYVLRRMPTWPSLAALCTVILALICAIVPLSFLGVRVVSEARHMVASLSDGSASRYIETTFLYTQKLSNQYLPVEAQFSSTLTSSVEGYTKEGLSWLVGNISGLFSSIAQLLFSVIIFLISLFYLLRDGRQLRSLLVHLSPLEDNDDDTVLNRLGLAVNSVVRGNLFIVLIQATLAAIGLALFGVPNPILWGMVAGVAALIPGLGTSLVLLPAAALLLISGAAGPAIGLLLWAGIVVGLVDNLLAPRLVGKGSQLHPLVVLLAVLGGLVLFGPAGLFLGPLFASLFLVLLSLYLRNSSSQ